MSDSTRRPSPALLVAIVALVAALGGGAYAASKIDSNDIEKQAVKAKNIARDAVKTKKIADGAVTGPKIGDGAVTTAKLDPAERSEAFVNNQPGAIAVQLDAPAFTDADRIAQLALPAGNYVVNANASFGSNAATSRTITCVIRNDGTVVTRGHTDTAGQARFSHTIALNAVVDGGAVDLACQTDGGAQARDRVLIANRVATAQTQ